MNSLAKSILISFGIGIVIFLIGNSLSRGFYFESFNDFAINFGIYQLYSFVLAFSNMYYFDYLNKRKWEDKENIKRIVVGIFGSVVITIIGLFLLRTFSSVYIQGNTFAEYIENENYKNYTFGIWITLTIVTVFHAIYFFKKNQENKVKESQIVAKNQTAKFESLKNQLDPHFLFNSLNVLTSLIGENPIQAEKFTTKLSKYTDMY